jgi:hypothetical protein
MSSFLLFFSENGLLFRAALRPPEIKDRMKKQGLIFGKAISPQTTQTGLVDPVEGSFFLPLSFVSCGAAAALKLRGGRIAPQFYLTFT